MMRDPRSPFKLVPVSEVRLGAVNDILGIALDKLVPVVVDLADDAKARDAHLPARLALEIRDAIGAVHDARELLAGAVTR